MTLRRTLFRAPLLVATMLVCISLPAIATDLDRHFSLEGGEIKIINLIGEIRLEGWEGETFEIDVAVRGKDATPDLIDIETEAGAKALLAVTYPDERRFVYPPMGAGSRTSLTIRNEDEGDGWFGLVLPFLTKGKIEVAGSGSGTEVWADVTVKVPKDKGEFAGLLECRVVKTALWHIMHVVQNIGVLCETKGTEHHHQNGY